MMTALRRSRASEGSACTVPDRVSIFVTVGTELPFDRLIGAIDHWAGQTGNGRTVFAQIGHTGQSPSHIQWAPMLGSADFRRLFTDADVVVAHAGMGTILAALESNRPLIVVPRRADLGEHRNDHQIATVARLTSLGLIDAADDEHEVVARLAAGSWQSAAPASIGPFGEPSLLETIRTAIEPTGR